MTSATHPVMILAGGTGGHVYPALAVAETLRARQIPVIWVGTTSGLEARVVPEAGFSIVWLSVSGLRGKGMLAWLLAPLRLNVALTQALMILYRHKPRVVLGMGGFVAGPCGLMAGLTGVPLVIHEQNAIAGLTNRLLSRLSRQVLEGFPNTFSRRNTIHTGNPVREAIASLPEPRLRLRLDSKHMKLLILGGSLGARALNETVPLVLKQMKAEHLPEVWHQTGVNNINDARKSYQDAGIEVRLAAYLEDMAEAYGWADLVVCRAGALTIAELAAAGVGSILVPYPYAVDDHQTANARHLVALGAAVLVPQPELSVSRLSGLLTELACNRSRLLDMACAARRFARPDASNQVAEICLNSARAED